jgi:cold shock CspA family protein
MKGEYFYGQTRRRQTARPAAERPGVHATGHVLKLFVGQGYGYIRAARRQDVYFHRSDLVAGHSINDLGVGDAVAFDLQADQLTGPRALRVRRCSQ